ncbi:hypothetical protein TRVL_01437 [Trypanosoma vivax]|nr:hypothetical protein TRVL_01437 [Trypanosoma vivax]
MLVPQEYERSRLELGKCSRCDASWCVLLACGVGMGYGGDVELPFVITGRKGGPVIETRDEVGKNRAVGCGERKESTCWSMLSHCKANRVCLLLRPPSYLQQLTRKSR